MIVNFSCELKFAKIIENFMLLTFLYGYLDESLKKLSEPFIFVPVTTMY